MQNTQYNTTNTMAIVSLVAGVLSWFFFPFFGAVVAIITGHVARNQIKISHNTEGGDGLAIAGLVLGYLNLLGSCVGFLFFLLIFGGAIGLSGCAILSEAANETYSITLSLILAN